MSEFINADCLEVMAKYPNGYFDLAIVDPPYFSGPEKRFVLNFRNGLNLKKQLTIFCTWEHR